MLRNYQFDDCVIKAATGVADKSKVQEASDIGGAAVDALNQINEYFDASDTSLQVNYVAPDRLKFVVKALKTCSDNIDRFMTYLPPSVVEAAKAQLEEENTLNKLEYKAADGSRGGYLNPAPGSLEQTSKTAEAAGPLPTAVTSTPLLPTIERSITASPKVPLSIEVTSNEIADLEAKLEEMKRMKGL